MAAPLQSSGVRAKRSDANDSNVNLLPAAQLETNASQTASPPAVAGSNTIASQPATRRTASQHIKHAVATNAREESRDRSSERQRAWKQRHRPWPAPLPPPATPCRAAPPHDKTPTPIAVAPHSYPGRRGRCRRSDPGRRRQRRRRCWRSDDAIASRCAVEDRRRRHPQSPAARPPRHLRCRHPLQPLCGGRPPPPPTAAAPSRLWPPPAPLPPPLSDARAPLLQSPRRLRWSCPADAILLLLPTAVGRRGVRLLGIVI